MPKVNVYIYFDQFLERQAASVLAFVSVTSLAHGSKIHVVSVGTYFSFLFFMTVKSIRVAGCIQEGFGN